MLLVLAAADSKDALRRELDACFSAPKRELSAGLYACDTTVERSLPLPLLAFARQVLPDARHVEAASVRAWASELVAAVAGVLPEHRPWSLHVYPFREVLASTRLGARAWHTRSREGQPLPALASASAATVSFSRCDLIRASALDLLHKRRRHLARYLREGDSPFGEEESLVQLVLTAPDRGFVSLAPAPLPFEQRHVLSCFRGGEVALAIDKEAPSRAFAKLVEAEARMGRRIGARETCVDLGASPGSWTYVAARRGARVTAVDRSELRADLMQQRNVRFQRGDAFRYEPPAPVDWLLCDVIAAAERSSELLLTWLRRRWCRRFVVTLKLDDAGSAAAIADLKRELAQLTSDAWLLRLCANKKEVCAFGALAAT